MKLTNKSWIISNATRIQNDGQRFFLGDVMLPTALQTSDLAESSLPPKTVSIYKLPSFIAVQKRAGLPVNQHLVFFHQLLSTPFKLIGPSCCKLYLASFFTADKNKIDYSGDWAAVLLFISCLILSICGW